MPVLRDSSLPPLPRSSVPAWTTTVRWRAVSYFFLHHKYLMTAYADDAVGANELDVAVRDGALGVTRGVSVDVAEITNVAGLVGGSTVCLAVGVDYSRFLSAACY